jgi:hypothetical protein
VSFCPFKVDVSGNGVADSGYEATAQSFENSFWISQIHTAIQQRRLSYEHVGQHGACSLKAIFSMTTECTEPLVVQKTFLSLMMDDLNSQNSG